jgi:adenylylsulfate kinase-like enzyme
MSGTSGVVWITGLSAAGKTTLGETLTNEMRKFDLPVIFLDGDQLRSILGEFSTHSREDRLRLAFVYARLCKNLSSQKVMVVIATVALFAEIHEWNRINLENYLEVFLDVPIDELRRRDPKGIYQRFEKGLVSNVAGLDLEVDFPKSPHVHFKFEDGLNPKAMVEIIMNRIETDEIHVDGELSP